MLWYVLGMIESSKHRPRLIVDRQSPDLREALWRVVREAKDSDGILAPVTVIGPSQYANLGLRQELGRSGFVNVRFALLPMLAEMLGASAMAKANRRPLTPALDNVLLRTVLENAGGLLANVREHRSTLAGIRASFRDLRRAPDSVRKVLEHSGGVRSEVVRLYHLYRSSASEDWYDGEDLAQAAADAVTAGTAASMSELGLVIFYLVRDPSPGHMKLIVSLALKGRCAAIFGTTGDERADGPVVQLADTLRPILGEPRPATPKRGGAPAGFTVNARIHISPDAHEEVRHAIRGIVAEAESGTPLHRMAVLFRMDPPYSSLVRDELRMAEIPMAGPGTRALADTASGRTLTGLLRLASSASSDHPLRRDEVMAWLTGCPVRRPRGLDRRLFSPSRWDTISRKAGVIGGIGQWRRRLAAYADWQEGGAGIDPDDLTDGQAERTKSEAAAARALLDFIENLAESIASGRRQATWTELCDWAIGLMNRYLRRTVPTSSSGDETENRRAAEEEQNARDKIYRMLEELKAADGVGRQTTLTEFRQVVEESLETPVGHLGVTGMGVFVSDFSAAVGMDFDAVWLVGMIEGAVPPRHHDDPLLPEPSWRDAGGRSRVDDRVSKERYDYLSAISTCRRLSLSYPVADPESRRKTFPSRWLLEQAEVLAGETVYADDLARFRDRPWLTIAQSLENSISRLEIPADTRDYDLKRLLRWRMEGNILAAHPLAQQGALSMATRLGRSRSSRRLTDFDGNLSGAQEPGIPAPNFLAPVVSATSLERWAVCPYRYFLANVLRLSVQEDPEEAVGISPMDSGLLVHKILERFLVSVQNTGQFPADGEAWGLPHRQGMMDIADSVFEEFESRGVTGKPLLWEIRKLGIRADLQKFLEEDEKLRQRFGTSSVLVETRFGAGNDWQEVVDEETQVRFRGAIDRVDLKADGSPSIIIDYKTGSPRSYKGLDIDPIDAGKHLQLGIYSLAAGHLAGSEGVASAYWFVSARGEFQFAPKKPVDVADPAVIDRLRRGVSTIAKGIRGGIFPANPGDGFNRDGNPVNCTYCDFNSLCPSRRLQIWERKKSDVVLSGYLSLSTDVEAPPIEEGEEE